MAVINTFFLKQCKMVVLTAFTACACDERKRMQFVLYKRQTAN